MILLSGQLLGSGCSYVPRLIAWAEQGVEPEVNYYAAFKLGDDSAAYHLLQLAEQNESFHWVRVLAQDEMPEARFFLAMRAESPSEKRMHLMAAGERDYAPALFELGIHDNTPESKVHFLQAAAELDYFPAQRALYQWHWFHEDYNEALPWLKKVARQDASEATTLALHFWRTRNRQEARNWLEKAGDKGSEQAKAYLELISRYWNKAATTVSVNQSELQCSMQLQFIATSLDSIKQAHEFYQTFNQDKRLATLPICLNPPIWIEDSGFNCRSRAVNNYRIECPLHFLDKVLEPDSFTHLAIFAKQGKANVVNGVMYLDLADKYSVFVHELAHFVGFVDEYPLSEQFSHYYCEGEQEFPNLIVVPESQTLDDVSLDKWQNLSQNLVFARANTCKNHSAQAYKFSEKLTFMEFHDTGYIPDIYKAIWLERLQSREHLRTAALDIAQSLEQVGNVPAAQKWWQRYNEWH